MSFKIMKESKVSIKGLKYNPASQIVYLGSFYFNNKKVGTFEEDCWAGKINCNFTSEEIESEVKADILEALTSLGFRSLSSNKMKPMVGDIEEYIGLIIELNTLVGLLKKRHKKMISDWKKAFKVKSFTPSQLEIFKSYIFVIPVTHNAFSFECDEKQYFFEIGNIQQFNLPSKINITSLKSKFTDADFFISVNEEGVMDRIN